jgi:hypothetical protein
MSEQNAQEYVLATARELYGRAVYSQKAQEKEREIWSRKAGWLNYINLTLITLTTAFAVVSAVLKPEWSLILTTIFAAASTAFVVGQTTFDPVGRESRHRTAAKELIWVRENLLFLIVRCHVAPEQGEQLLASLQTITRELTSIYKFAPDTSPKALESTRSALKAGEFTFSDDEIDAFLPLTLRKNQLAITPSK